jgi:hypothetical protein
MLPEVTLPWKMVTATSYLLHPGLKLAGFCECSENDNWAREVAHVVERLPGKPEVLSSISSTGKKKKESSVKKGTLALNIMLQVKCTISRSSVLCLVLLLWEFASWDMALFRQFILLCQQTWQTHVQRLSLENKGVSPYIPLQAGYRSKEQVLIHIWLYLILLATLP